MLPQGLYCTIALLTLSFSFSDAQSDSFWNSYAPGELLRNLDLMTLNEEWQTTTEPSLPPLAPQNTPAKQRKRAAAPRKDYAKSAEQAERYSFDGNDSDSEQADNYDQAYEAFVREYFSKAKDEDASSFSASFENDGETFGTPLAVKLKKQPATTRKPTKEKPSKQQSKQKHCKEVKESKHLCIVCKNPKTGEHSKSCSYQQEAGEPQKYAYEVGRKYKKQKDAKYRDESGSSSSEEVEEQPSKSKANVAQRESSEYNDSLEVQATQYNATNVRRHDKDANNGDSSSCVKKQTTPNKTCFYCRDSLGDKYVKCFAEYGNPVKATTTTKAPGRISKHAKQKQRIYKRTVTYTYEHSMNGTKPAAIDDDEVPDLQELQTVTPKAKRKLIVKIIKRKLQ